MKNMPSPKSQKPAKDDEQVKAFRKKARELGCDEDPKAFERAFSKIVPPKRPKPKPNERRKKP